MVACTEYGESARLIFRSAVTLHPEVHIRHGTAIVIRNVHWLITDQKIAENVLGRPILEALGLNTRNLLAATAEKLSGGVGAALLLYRNEEQPDGRVARVIEVVFPADGGEDKTEPNKHYGESSDIETES